MMKLSKNPSEKNPSCCYLNSKCCLEPRHLTKSASRKSDEKSGTEILFKGETRSFGRAGGKIVPGSADFVTHLLRNAA